MEAAKLARKTQKAWRANAPAPASPSPPAPPPEDPIDLAIRTRNKTGLPPEQHAEFQAILQAFVSYEAGSDEAARAALQTLGLKSPFQDWKLLIRGLMAYSTGDDARTIENWQRLIAGRLPARLAAPLRDSIDASFHASQPPQTASRMKEEFQTLLNDTYLNGLRDLRRDLGRGRPLTNAIRTLERILPIVRQRDARLVPKLANILYRAILGHGDPTDLPKYLRLFGKPTDDPDFYRINALAFDKAQDHHEAIRFWNLYVNWLSKHPESWPPDIAQRARAIILYRVGTLAADAAELDGDPADDLQAAFQRLMGGARGPLVIHRPPQPKPPDPIPLWQRAMALAPDWEAPAKELFDYLQEHEKFAEAEAVAKKLIEHNPNAITMMTSLATLLVRNGNAESGLEYYRKALANNPLDKSLRTYAGCGYLAAARKHLISGDVAKGESRLGEGEELCRDGLEAGYWSLRTLLALKAGNKELADQYRIRVEAIPHGRVAAALFMAVDVGLAKFKPAQRKPYELALITALGVPATPREVMTAGAGLISYTLEGIEYRGQKTHVKKIDDLIVRTHETDSPEIDFENLGSYCLFQAKWKVLEKYAANLAVKFPKNPVFVLHQVEAAFGKAKDRPPPWGQTNRLMKRATDLAQRSTEPRHRAVLERITELSGPGFGEDYFPDFF